MSLTAHLAHGKQVLAALPAIAQLSPRVWRVLGCNPGSYTLQSTNTYLVGTGAARILVDTGEGQAAFPETLAEGMAQAGCSRIAQIIITHWHHDHLGGVPSVLHLCKSASTAAAAAPPPVRKFMPAADEELFGGEGSIDPYSIMPRGEFVPLADGEIVQTEGARLRVVYTPGHANDHVCLVLEEEGSMFTADNVLGTGTSVFKDLHAYLSSLRKMAEEKPERLYPGHGPCVENGEQRIVQYIEHRMRRVAQVVGVLSDTFAAAGGGSGGARPSGWSIERITREMYAGLAEQLVYPAMANTRQVLLALSKDGVVQEEAAADSWRLLVPVEEALSVIGASSGNNKDTSKM
jgi:ribonuclease/clavin/mitogillin